MKRNHLGGPALALGIIVVSWLLTEQSLTSAGSPISLTRGPGEWQLKARQGVIDGSVWVGPKYLLVSWAATYGPPAQHTYLLNPDAGRLYRVPGPAADTAFADPTGKRAILVWGTLNCCARLGAALTDLSSGTTSTIFTLDPAIPQWAAPADRRWDFGAVSGVLGAQWIGTDRVVLTLTPQDTRNIEDWGKVLLVDLRRHHVTVLAEQGSLLGVSPDGGLLLRRGWVDAAVQLLLPPYVGPAQTVSPGGSWTTAWAVSPDGEHIAWLEGKAPPGDWSQQLPYVGSGEPLPDMRTVAIWDRKTGRIQRFPVSGLIWYRSRLHWRNDSHALLFTAYPDVNTVGQGLFQLALDGSIRLLDQPAWTGGIAINTEGPDRSVYFTVWVFEGGSASQLTRVYPDGRVVVLREGSIADFHVDDQARLVIEQESTTTFQDLRTGQTWRVGGAQAEFPLNGRWASYRDANQVLHVVKVR